MNEILERLLSKKKRFLDNEIPAFKRTAYSQVKDALSKNSYPILFGLRRTGKTTILKQILKENVNDSIYITFRDTYISRLNKYELEELIEYIYEKKYRLLLLDEAQINPNWSDLIVSIFDSFPDMKVVVTGSSSLNLESKETGLDRTRKINIETLNYGEFLELTNTKKSKESFEEYLGNYGFPKYAIEKVKDYDIQRGEIFDEIINHDIPNEFKNVKPTLMSRLIYVLSRLTNGEVNVNKLIKSVSPNFQSRDALEYIDVLEKSKIINVVYRINENCELPKVKKFKVYINPHIHLWLLNTSFSSIDERFKGHIIESYWLTWAYSINNYNKKFYYIKKLINKKIPAEDKELEIDFATLDQSGKEKQFKTLHELKYTMRKNIDLSFMKTIKSRNKIIWNIDGNDTQGIKGKSLLETYDKPL